jgi:hypothetical protein
MLAFARRFARFWYDFLVGDRWELFIGPIAALLAAAALSAAGGGGLVAGGALFLLVVITGGLSVATQSRG